jgi:hypothetical protein
MRLTQKPCKGCGAPVLWVRVDCKAIPLDPRPAVYMLLDGLSEVTADRANGGPPSGGKCYVTHFATCPNVSEFSRGGKRGSQQDA